MTFAALPLLAGLFLLPATLAISAHADLGPGAAPTPAKQTLQPEIAIRTGEHGGFGRVVFDVPNGASVEFTGQDGRVIARLRGGVAGHVGPLTRNLRGIAANGDQVSLALAQGATWRASNLPGRAVVDVFDPAVSGARPLLVAFCCGMPASRQPRDPAIQQASLRQAMPGDPAPAAALPAAAEALSATRPQPAMPVRTAAAQPTGSQPAAPPQPAPGLPAMLSGDLAAAAAEDTERPVKPQAITLDAGRGTMLRLPAPAASVLAADPAIARVQPASPTRLFLIAVAPGHTTVLATSANGAIISQFEVTVVGTTAAPAADNANHADPSGAEAAITLSVPSARNVRVRAVGKDLEVSGVVPTPAAAQEVETIVHAYLGGEKSTVINDLVVLGSIQVNVRVRFAEIDRTVTRELGFNWQALTGAKGGFQLGVLTGVAGTAAGFPISSLGLTGANGVPVNQIGVGSTRWDVNNIIDALASDQLITILAEPNLTALSGETASFLAGGEFPVPVAGSTTGEITISFKQFGISLSVVPTVLSPDRLNLRVRPEVSDLSDTGAISVPLASGTVKIPALTVRRAETTVELGSGQSFAIAGLLQKKTTQEIDALPGIGEVPVLGALFRSTAFQRAESELVIIVTPYLVNPATSPARLHAPTDKYKSAVDLDRILYGRQLARGAPASATPIDAGFILR